MAEHLPDLFDPLEFAEKRRRIHGCMSLAGMDRLRSELLDDQGEATVDLAFGREGRVATITGHVEANLVLQCQCCLESMAWLVRCDVRLGMAGSIDEANRLPESMEALIVSAGASVALADLVQDELLLAIPPIPRHPDCHLPEPRAASPEKPNPFAELAQLKTKSPLE